MAKKKRPLTSKVEAAVARKNAPPPPKEKKPIPLVDPGPRKIVAGLSSTIREVMGSGFDRIEKAIDKLSRAQRELIVDTDKIGEAVAKEIAKMPKPEQAQPVREPVTYRATIERRGNQMVGALIEPVKGK